MEIQIATELLDYLREFEDRYKLKHNGHIEYIGYIGCVGSIVHTGNIPPVK